MRRSPHTAVASPGTSSRLEPKGSGGQYGPSRRVTPPAMERAGRQFRRCRAEVVRHCRRARLRGPSSATDVVIVTELPSREQHVTSFDGVTLSVNAYLEDEALAALAESFSPSPRL